MLRKFFDWQLELVEKNPALQPFKPLVQATDTFFYGMPSVTKESPHIRDGVDIKRFMITVWFAVAPAIIAAIYFYGLQVIPIILVSYIVGGIAEVAFCIIRKEEITEGFLITGILYPLILPVTIPLWMVAVGIVVGVVLGKEVFGGSGRNPFNAALVARCFIYICFPLQMTGGAFIAPDPQTIDAKCVLAPEFKGTGGFTKYKIDTKSTATPLAVQKEHRLKMGTKEGYDAYMKYVKETLPSLFWGNRGGCIGETSSILLLLGGLMLMIARVANWRTILSALFSAGLFAFLLYDGQTVEDRLCLAAFSLLSGGMLFGCIFMATDPVSGPATQLGRYFYGFGIGFISVLIRRYSGYPEGVMFAILLMNTFAALIDELVVMAKYRNVKKAA